MNKVLLMSAALLLMPLPALSQGASEPEDRGASQGSRRERDLSELLRGLGDEGFGGSPRRGASFLLRSGDATIAVRCDPRESMRTCLELTGTLLEKARSAMSGGAPATPPPRQ